MAKGRAKRLPNGVGTQADGLPPPQGGGHPETGTIAVTPAPADQLHPLREAYRREMACQIVHDSWHARGLAASYLLEIDGQLAGYGSVGGPPGEPRDIVKELYLLPDARRLAVPLFRALVAATTARHVEAQTNDQLLLLMLFDCANAIGSETVLFADASTTRLLVPGATLRRLSEDERARVFAHHVEPPGEYGLELDGEVVATGGLLFHYNPPYGDLYMEVSAGHRRQGLGSYLVQELKRLCYEGGHMPAARCHQSNVASRRTLERAGLLPCARIVRGRLAESP